VSPEWQPDDSLSDPVGRGKRELKGTKRIKDALKGVAVNRIITSRDARIGRIQKTLKRPARDLPRGVEHYQLPVALGRQEDVLSFMSHIKPGTKVGDHSHKKVTVFRVVIQGSMESAGVTLGPGDWMLVPPGQPYSVVAGPEGCVTYYAHFTPPRPKGPRVRPSAVGAVRRTTLRTSRAGGGPR